FLCAIVSPLSWVLSPESSSARATPQSFLCPACFLACSLVFLEPQYFPECSCWRPDRSTAPAAQNGSPPSSGNSGRPGAGSSTAQPCVGSPAGCPAESQPATSRSTNR